MTLYLLVVGLLVVSPKRDAVMCANAMCDRQISITCNGKPCDYKITPEDENAAIIAPRVDFFLSQDTATKEYAAHPKGSARLFKIGNVGWSWCERKEDKCFLIKELNVLPAQSYEVSDKASVEARP